MHFILMSHYLLPFSYLSHFRKKIRKNNRSDKVKSMRGIFGIHQLTAIAGDPQNDIDFYTSVLELNAAPIMDRTYFHSVYFGEPGCVLFKTATDPSCFPQNQKPSELGTRMMLPEWLESERKYLEKILPRLTLPNPNMESRGRKK